MTEEHLTPLPPLPPKTTERQRRFFEIWGDKYNFSFDRGCITRAYILAGYSPLYAEHSAWACLQSPNLNKVVREIMTRKNITFERLIGKLDELLDAEHPAYQNKPDNAIQLKAFQDSMKLYGGYPIPIQKVDVRHSEEYHISIEDQRNAEDAIQEFIDVEQVDDGTSNPEEERVQDDRPFR